MSSSAHLDFPYINTDYVSVRRLVTWYIYIYIAVFFFFFLFFTFYFLKSLARVTPFYSLARRYIPPSNG
jgi:hypothetical protein